MYNVTSRTDFVLIFAKFVQSNRHLPSPLEEAKNTRYSNWRDMVNIGTIYVTR